MKLEVSSMDDQHRIEFEVQKAALIAAWKRVDRPTNKVYFEHRLADLEADERDWQERHKAA